MDVLKHKKNRASWSWKYGGTSNGIVEHPGFEAVCLNYWELQATWQYKQKYGASAYEGSDHKKKQAHCLQAIGKVVLGLPLSIAFWNSVTLFLFCFLLLCHCVTRSCQVTHFLIGLQIIRFYASYLDVIIVNGMMYQVNQRCRFLSWTERMNRCYWCILGLHAHAILYIQM